jgi:hypothetical protein
MAATIEVMPLSDDGPISMVRIQFKHRECLGEARAVRSMADSQFTVRCICGLEVRLDEEAAGQIQKIAIGEEPHPVKEHTIYTNDPPVTFKAHGEV